MPHLEEDSDDGDGSTGPRRLVLCFDGTGDKFQGNESDTNIVKLYQMLERNKPGQFHYYQRLSSHLQRELFHLLFSSPAIHHLKHSR